MNLLNHLRENARAIFNSGTSYAAIDVSVSDYAPDSPFKAIIVGTAGEVEIVGLDGEAVVITCEAGLHPYGGSGIKMAGTTAGGLIVVR